MYRLVLNYCVFVNQLTNRNYNPCSVLFSFQFWPSLFLFICSRNSKFPYLVKIGIKLILRLTYGIETTTKCVVDAMPYLPHPRNIINGAQYIGKNVVIYHNVTIGAKRIDVHFTERPSIMSGAVLATGAVVVGSGATNENFIARANSLTLL